MTGRRMLYEAWWSVRKRLEQELSDDERSFLDDLNARLARGLYVAEEDIKWMAGLLGIRNPAFEGDMVGWLDDDFDDDDEDENGKPKKRRRPLQ